MSTHSAEAKAAEKQDDKAHDQFDDQTGVYGWFRRNQKKLLYSVGLFTLLTFSVSGPMMAAVNDLFNPPRDMPTMQVGQTRVTLKAEDFLVGQQIANHLSSLATVVPVVDVGEGGRSEMGDVYGWLRRAAITEGIDVSLIEVDRAIAALQERTTVKSPTQLARQRGFQSLAEFQMLVAEAMRIGTLLRLQTLALDSSDARILEKVLADREKITFRVATYDEKARDEALKAAGGVTDDDLKKWLEGKDDVEKNRLQVFDTNRVALNLGAVLFTDFDRTQWLEDALKDFPIGVEQRKKLYGMERERFKNPDGTYKAEDDETVVAELDKLIETEKVMQFLLQKLNEKRNELTKTENEERQKAHEEFFAAQNELSAADAKVAEKPDDQPAKEEQRLAKEKLTARETAKKLADEAADARFAAFDFPAAFAELTKDKKGFVQRSFPEKRNAEQLKDLEANGLELGEWAQASNATYLQRKGDLGFAAARSTKAAFVYHVTDIEVRPLKSWDKLQPLLEGAYFTEKAKTEADAKKKQFEDALLRMAKEKMTDKVTEIEGKRQTRIDEKLTTWQTQTEAKILNAERMVNETKPGEQSRIAWEKELAGLRAMLEKKDDKKKEFETEIDLSITTEIGDEAKKFHGQVLDAAATEAGFVVTEVGPLPRDLAQRPRFDKKYDPTQVFLFRSHGEMKEGESTGLVQDLTNRRWHVATCTKVEPLTAADVERREFQTARQGGFFQSFASEQAITAYGQAFTKEALQQRYDVKTPGGTMVEPGK